LSPQPCRGVIPHLSRPGASRPRPGQQSLNIPSHSTAIGRTKVLAVASYRDGYRQTSKFTVGLYA
jgi:hypothetical protein